MLGEEIDELYSRNIDFKRYNPIDGFSFESTFTGNTKGMKKPTQKLRDHVRSNPTEPAPKVRGWVVDGNNEYVKEDKYRKKTGGLREGISMVKGRVTNKPDSSVSVEVEIPTSTRDDPVDVKLYLPNLRDFGLANDTTGTYYFKIFRNGEQIGDAQVNFVGGRDNAKDLFKIFMSTSDTSYLTDGNNYEIKMFEFEDVKFKRQKYNQIYAGLGTCVFDPILAHINDKNETDTKQKELKRIGNLMEKNPDGLDELGMQRLSNSMKVRLNIFTPTNKLISCFEPVTKKGKPLKVNSTYNYVNTEMNHVDNWTIQNFNDKRGVPIKIDFAKDMHAIYNSLIERNIPFLYRRSNRIQGVNSVSAIETKDEVFKLDDPVSNLKNKLLKDFPQQFSNMHCDISDFDSSVLNFVHQATYINGLHTFDDECDLLNMRDSIKEHDIEKAYATFYQSPYFEQYGLPTPPTDFVSCLGMDPLEIINKIGWTQITNIILDKSINSHCLANLENNNIYPNIELLFLWDKGVRFEVVNTAYTCCPPKTDFRFPKEYIDGVDHPDYVIIKKDGKKVKQKPYAIIVGMMSSCSLSNTTNYKYSKQPSQEWIDNLCAYDEEIRKVSILKGEKTLVLHKPRDSVSSMCHIASYITAYVRVRLYAQIDNYKHPVLVNSDCIKFIDEEANQILPSGWRAPDMDKINLNYNEKFDSYHSCKNKVDYWKVMKRNDENAWLPQFVFYNGVGGSGKTTTFINSRLINKALTFPTHGLKAEKEGNDNGIRCFTHHSFFKLGSSHGLDDKDYHYYQNILVDEITMRNEEEVNEIIQFAKLWSMRVIFAGDIHFKSGVPYQLQPVKFTFQVQPLLDVGCKEVLFKDNHRCKDTKLKFTLDLIRKNMTNHIEAHADGRYNVKKLTSMFAKYFKQQTISYDDAIQLYNENSDLFLCGTHLSIDGTNQILKERRPDIKPVYRLTDTYRNFKNGQIFWGDDAINTLKNTTQKELSYATTVHSVQGKTFEGRLFIIYDDFFELGMFYTAVSRVRYLDQIRLIA